jgi:hypothetical protein
VVLDASGSMSWRSARADAATVTSTPPGIARMGIDARAVGRGAFPAIAAHPGVRTLGVRSGADIRNTPIFG